MTAVEHISVRAAISRSLGLLTKRDRRLFWTVVAIQMSTALLDLLGVVLIGMVAALSVTSVQSQPVPPPIANVLNLMGLGALGTNQVIVVLAGSAAMVLLFKSAFSSFLTRRAFIFLANRQALVSGRIARALFSQSLTFIQRRSTSSTAYALIQGTSTATLVMLGQVVVLATEIALLAVLSVALIAVNPIMALGSIVYFTLIALTLQRAMGRRASRLGNLAADADVESLEAIQEGLSAYRELLVMHRRHLYVDRIQRARWRAARVAAEFQVMAMFPKYMFEAALVVGGFALALALFATEDATAAVATLAVFVAAASRIMPSLMRLQGSALLLRGSASVAQKTFELWDELGQPRQDPERLETVEELRQLLSQRPESLRAPVSVNCVTFTYPGSSQAAVSAVSLDIPTGSSVALVGRSGSGKSTLADLILGVLTPESGDVRIGGLTASEFAGRFRGAIGYVPQEVPVARASVRDNVALGLPSDAVNDDDVWAALTRANLNKDVREMEQGLDTIVGDGAKRLSGGQRQRLGLARALLTKPVLLVLDEATSALDAETEFAVTQMLSELHGQVTVVVIAHRLSTVRSVDQLAYFEEGYLKDIGRFEDVRARVPALERQAQLMGL